jgi:hypothetical protein
MNPMWLEGARWSQDDYLLSALHGLSCSSIWGKVVADELDKFHRVENISREVLAAALVSRCIIGCGHASPIVLHSTARA